MEKSISTIRFIGNQWDELRLWQESSFFFFTTDINKCVVAIGIHDIHALVSKKTNQPFISLKINGRNFVCGKNLVSFCNGCRQMGSFHWDTRN